MGIENELSQICAMIESGKLCYADAVYYLNLMRKKYGIWEKEFRQICDVWSQKGELSGELDRHRDRAVHFLLPGIHRKRSKCAIII